MGSGSGSGSGSSSACALDASYSPTFGSDTMTQNADDKPTGYFGSGSGSNPQPSVHQIWYGALLADQGDVSDILWIDLYAKYGGFGSGDIVPGSYAIANDELTYANCGICIYASGDFDANGATAQWYMATAGNLTLNQVMNPNGSAAGRISGSWTGVMLKHVEDDGNGFIGGDATPAADGCTSAIGNASFDIPLNPPMGSGSATGKPLDHIRIPVKVSRAKTLHHRFY